MPVLSIAFQIIHIDVKLGLVYTLADVTVGATNDSWNKIDLTISQQFSQLTLVSYSIFVTAAATFHPTTTSEGTRLVIQRQGKTIGEHAIPERWRSTGGTNASPGVLDESFISEDHPLFPILEPGDILGFIVPPADDHATAATGKYTIQATFVIVKK